MNKFLKVAAVVAVSFFAFVAPAPVQVKPAPVVPFKPPAAGDAGLKELFPDD